MKTLPIAVDNRLYRGPKPGIKRFIQLKELGVTQVIDLMRNEHLREKLMCSLLGMKYVHISSSILDNEFVHKEHIEEAIKYITENSGNTYVHCGRGTHRTGVVCAGYDMCVNKIGLNEALEKDIFTPGYYSPKEKPNLAKNNKKRAKIQNVYNMISKQLKIFIDEFSNRNNFKERIESYQDGDFKIEDSFDNNNILKSHTVRDEFDRIIDSKKFDENGLIKSSSHFEYYETNIENGFIESYKDEGQEYIRKAYTKIENGLKHTVDDFTSISVPEKSYINDFVYDLKGNLWKLINNGVETVLKK